MLEIVVNKKNKTYFNILILISLLLVFILSCLIFRKDDVIIEKTINVQFANYDFTQRLVDSSGDKPIEGQMAYEINGKYAKDELMENGQVTVYLPNYFKGDSANSTFTVYTQGWYSTLQEIDSGVKLNSNGSITFNKSDSIYLKKYVITKNEIVVEFNSNRIDNNQKELIIGEVGDLDIKLMPGGSTNYSYEVANNGVLEAASKGNSVRIKALKSGRASFTINFSNDNISTNIIFVVKNSDGTIDEANADTGTGLSNGSGDLGSSGEYDTSGSSKAGDSRNADPSANADGTIAGGTVAELDRLDFLNAYEMVYKEYYVDEETAAKQIARLKVSMSLAYSGLKKSLAKMGEDPDKLPVVYGKSLGLNANFAGISSGSSTSYGGFVWPIPSQVGKYTIADVLTSPFGPRIHPIWGDVRIHQGIDIGASTGTEVVAIKAGTVTEAAYSGGWGNRVKIDHGNGYASAYNHLSAIKVNVGDKVTQGQIIGLIGSTGDSTGPHLDFQIFLDGEAIDPLQFYNDDLSSKFSPTGEMPNIPGEGAERWREYVKMAIIEVESTYGFGMPTSGADYDDLVNRTLQQIHIESTADPESINDWDSNSSFDCSVGLIQAISSTFNSHKRPACTLQAYAFAAPKSNLNPADGRLNGYENIVACLKYSVMRYGSPYITKWPTSGGY